MKKIIIILLVAISILSSCSKEDVPGIDGMVYVSPGKFTIGSSDKDNNGLAKEFGSRQKIFFENEKPVRTLFLKGFYLDRFEVTNDDFKRFSVNTGYVTPPHWENGMFGTGREKHPVFNITWFGADAYCSWKNKRLPTEEEWEKAARGLKGYRYPWGNIYDEKKANFTKKDTVPVRSMPEDVSYYGIYDMAGNLMEWTSSWYEAYPGSDFHLKEYGKQYKVVKGSTGNITGHYHLAKIYSRSSFRHFSKPNDRTYDVGFRCAKDKG